MKERAKKVSGSWSLPWVLTACVFLLPSQASKVVEDIDYLYMHIGLQMDYPLPEEFKKEKLKFSGNYTRYATGKYRPNKNDIRWTPKRRGSGVMIIKNQKNEILKQLNIDVQKDNLHKIAAELRDLLIAVDGIEVKIYNRKVIVDGQVLLPREMDRINAVVAEYDERLVKTLVTYSPEAQRQIGEIIEKEIGYPEVTIRYAYNRFLLEGCVNSAEERERANSIANLYTQFDVSSTGKEARRQVNIVQNRLTVPCESEKKAEEEEQQKTEIKKLIQIVVHFVEMSKSFNKGFLFEWSPAIGDQGTQVSSSIGNVPGIPRGITAVLTATVSNFFPKLNWAKSFGFARVLHNSSLLVEEGVKGIISSNTQVSHVTTQGVHSPTVAQVTTEVKPTIIGEGENFIKMNTSIQVSSPASSQGTTTRTLRTIIHVRDGSSAAIGGLITSSLKRGYNPKSPHEVAGGNPILNLYSAKQYETIKSQFVVFITPLIKSHSHIGVERIKKKFKLDE